MARYYGTTAGMNQDIGQAPIGSGPLHGSTSRESIPWGTLNIVSYIAEIGLSLIPGVGPAIAVGIGIAGAVARLGIAFGEGQVNPITESIDFGSAFIPGLQAGIDNLKLGKSLVGDTTKDYINSLKDENMEQLNASALGLNKQTYDELQKWTTLKAKYDANTTFMYENRLSKISESISSRYEQLTKYYTKVADQLKVRGIRDAEMEVRRMIKFLKDIDPVKHPKRFNTFSQRVLAGKAPSLSSRVDKMGDDVSRSTFLKQEWSAFRGMGGTQGGQDVGALSKSQVARGQLDFQTFVKYREILRANDLLRTQTWSHEFRSNMALSRSAVTKVNRGDARLLATQERWEQLNAANAHPSFFKHAGLTPQGERIYKTRPTNELQNSKLMSQKAMGEMFSKEIYAQILDPLANNETTLQELIDSVVAQITSPEVGSSKAASMQRSLLKSVNSRAWSIDRNAYNKIVRVTKERDARVFRQGREFTYSTALTNKIKKLDDLMAIRTRENAILDNISKKLAEIKPSFRTNKGYIMSLINVDFEEADDALKTKLSSFIFASSRKKEKMLAELIYRSALKNFLDAQTEESTRAICLALFEGLGRQSPKKLHELFLQTEQSIAKNLSPETNEFFQTAFTRGFEYYYKRNPLIGINSRYKLGNSMNFRYWSWNASFHGAKFKLKVSKIWMWTNPLTMARALPDSAYQSIKSFIDKRAESNAARDMAQFGADFDKTVKEYTTEQKAEQIAAARIGAEFIDDFSKNLINEEEAAKTLFVKSGGVLLPPNRYLIGYRVLDTTLTEARDSIPTLFMFDKIHTRALGVGYKNSQGKKDVIVQCTRNDLEQLATIGVEYYWQVGGEKGWFITRGGRSVGANALSNDISLFLGFLPINTIRNVLTFTTATEYETVRWMNGRNTKNLGNKLFSTMVRTSINRAGRLLARYPISSLSGKMVRWTGHEITDQAARATFGRESQRAISAALALTITTDSKGQLRFETPSASKMMWKSFNTGAMTFKRQAFTRSSRYRNSYIRQIVGSQRKLNTVRRVTGLYPRSLPHGYRIGTIHTRKKR